jgi:hypothetical protein
MVVEIPLEADVRCSAEGIFDVITDSQGQDRWLARSAAFKGTVDVSNNPVGLGSTYREPTPQGVRCGEVIEFDRPTRITFHQPMSLRPFGANRHRAAVHARAARRGNAGAAGGDARSSPVPPAAGVVRRPYHQPRQRPDPGRTQELLRRAAWARNSLKAQPPPGTICGFAANASTIAIVRG